MLPELQGSKISKPSQPNWFPGSIVAAISGPSPSTNRKDFSHFPHAVAPKRDSHTEQIDTTPSPTVGYFDNAEDFSTLSHFSFVPSPAEFSPFFSEQSSFAYTPSTRHTFLTEVDPLEFGPVVSARLEPDALATVFTLKQ